MACQVEPLVTGFSHSHRLKILPQAPVCYHTQFSTSLQHKIQTPVANTINSVSIKTSYVHLDTNNLNKIPVRLKKASSQLEDFDPIFSFCFMPVIILNDVHVHICSDPVSNHVYCACVLRTSAFAPTNRFFAK